MYEDEEDDDYTAHSLAQKIAEAIQQYININLPAAEKSAILVNYVDETDRDEFCSLLEDFDNE